MDDQDRRAVTHFPPPPEVPSDVAAAASTIPPAGGNIPAELAPESESPPPSDQTLRASEHFPSDEVHKLSVQKLLDMNGRVEGYMKELLDPDGAFNRQRLQTVSDVAIMIDNGFKRIADAFEPRLTGIEAKISKQGETILALEVRVGALEKLAADMRTELEELKKGQTGGTAEADSPAAAPTA